MLAFSDATGTETPPMMLPLRAMQVIVAPLPRGITVPTGIGTGAPAVVVCAAATQLSKLPPVSVDPFS